MTFEIDFDRLGGLGMNADVASHASRHFCPEDTDAALMRVTEVHRESLQVDDGRQSHVARALPRLARELLEADDALAVGDWVRARCDSEGRWWIHQRMPPLSRIVRRDADGSRHAVVANVDVALLVMGLDDDFQPRRLERYLALVHSGGVRPVVVLSKVDEVSFRCAASRVRELHERMPHLRDVLAVDGRHPAAAEALERWLTPGRTVVLLGSSGAGKSTLTNTLIGRAVQDTGAVREHDSRGKHTTTSRTLHRLPGGACVIDTPGLRALRPDLDEHALASLFDDVATAAARCRFRDCRHGGEPGCAVRATLDPDRLMNYNKMLREARRDSMTALERQRVLSQWKAGRRAGRARLRMKRGEA